MTWRLRSIALYSRRDGSLKEWAFTRDGKVLNFAIISGASSRGKSTIVEIVDYCLLSKHCTIPKGLIRDAVSHVAVLLEGERNRMVVLRPLPDEGRLTSSEVFIQQGADIEFPTAPPEHFTWNRDTAKAKLSEFTGIDSPPVLTISESSDWLDRGAANIRHCAPYLFQPQDVIASRNVTFPGIEGGFERLHTLDALRYFLGVFTMDDLKKKYELRRLLLERTRLGRQLVESRALRTTEDSRAQLLWNEARNLGVVRAEETPDTHSEMVQHLAGLVSDGKLKVHDESSDLYADAQQEEADLVTRLQERRLELAKYQGYRKAESQHAETTEAQLERLRLRDLLPKDISPERCPLCKEGSLDAADIQSRLNDSLRALEEIREMPSRFRSRLERQCKKLEQEIDELKKSLEQVRARMRTILVNHVNDKKMLDRVRALARFEGTVVEYLRTAKTTSQTLQLDASSMEERIAELESEVGENAVVRKIEAIQSIIGTNMTLLAKRLDVEFPGKPVRLNLNELMIEVAVDTSNYVPLGQLGSGANWLGYHIAASLALHGYFRLQARPVPRLLILDQPSQVWFPAAEAKFQGKELPGDPMDLESLKKVYDLLDAVAKQKHTPQIIALDHARLGTALFQEAMVADWHEEGEGLVPREWLT